MQKSSIKKLSILGLVLIGASAVTAAVLPKNNSKDDSPRVATDRLQASTTGGQTCVEAADNDCNATAASSTTLSGGQTSTSGLAETTFANGSTTNAE